MNQVNIVKKRANKSKKKNYYSTDKNEQNPYNIQGRVTLPLNFLHSIADKKTIRGNNDSDKWTRKEPNNRVAVNYKSATDYYVKTMKEKPKNIVQNDDCSIFKEINRLFRNKFESKSTPSEPERSPFCVNLTKQLKGIRVENFRKSSVRRICCLIQSDELDKLPEVDSVDGYHRNIVTTRRNPFENVPAIPSFKFVFTTPIKQSLNLVTRIDLSGLDFNQPDQNNLSDTVLTFSPPGTISINQNNSSVLEVSSFLLESFRNEENRKPVVQQLTTPIYPIENSNFRKFMSFSNAENFQKRITSPITQNYKRSKVYFTPPETFFEFNFPETQFGRGLNNDLYGKFNFFMEPSQDLFEKPFVSTMFTKNYFDLD